MGQLQKCRITLEDQEEALISPQISNGSWSSEPKNSSKPKQVAKSFSFSDCHIHGSSWTSPSQFLPRCHAPPSLLCCLYSGKEALELNLFKQWLHWCGFSLLCTVLTCHLRLFLLLNFLKHWLQSFGFSLGCTECLSIVLDFRGLACTSLLLRLWNFRTRFFKLPRRKKLAPHSLHTNSSGFESEVRLCFFCRCLFSPSFCLKFLPSHSVHSQKAWFQDGHSHGSAGPVQLKSFWNTNCIWTSSLCQSSCASLEPDQILTWTLPASSIWLSNSLQSVIFGGRLSTLTWFDRFWCWAILLPLQSLKKSDFSSYHHQHLPPTPHLEHLDFVTSKQTFHMLNPVDRCQKKVNFVLQLLTLQLIPN